MAKISGHSLGGASDATEQLAGAFQAAAITAAIQREISRLKPLIQRDLVQARGTLLVLRIEKCGISGHISRVQCVGYGGPGNLPEPIIHKWNTSPHLFPKSAGTVEETFLWVVRERSLRLMASRPPGYYPSGKTEYKVLVYERDIAPL